MIIGKCSECGGQVKDTGCRIFCVECGAVPIQPKLPVIPMKPQKPWEHPWKWHKKDCDYWKDDGSGPRPIVRFEQECLHENCQGCKNGTCSGVHMISCPCRKCSPGYL